MAESTGDRVRQRRQQLQLSQEDLANIVGVSQTSIAKLENNPSRKSRHLLQIAEALQCDPKWLESGDEIPVPDPPESLWEQFMQASSNAPGSRLDKLETELAVVREINSRILLEIIALRAEVKDLKKGGDHSE